MKKGTRKFHINNQLLTYEQYLLSEEWKEKRFICLEMANYICVTCGWTKDFEHGYQWTSNLHAHHKSYVNLGTEKEINDLVCLCSDCHMRIHDIKKVEKESKPSNKKLLRLQRKENNARKARLKELYKDHPEQRP
jgi:predicted HNH restriction endonuclease